MFSLRSIKVFVGLLTFASAGILLQGCVSGIRAANSGVTTLANYETGNLVPMTVFSTTDVIRFYVSITWDDVNQEAGSRVVDWNWYDKEGKLVGHHENFRAYLKSAPNTRFATQPASALGVGHFRVECRIDGQPIASAEFDIR